MAEVQNTGFSSPTQPQTPDPTRLSTLWPIPSSLFTEAGTALNALALLFALSFFITFILCLRRHFRRKRLGFDLEGSKSHHGYFSGSGAYGRFGLVGFPDGGEADEAGKYKLKCSPRPVKGLKGAREGRRRAWDDWVGDRGRERDRDRGREKGRDRERHAERGRQFWRGRGIGDIGMGPQGRL